ncbi:alanine racemase [Butyrivibrio sp. JL13D10]|uniref:alanine racemase n=1 Tax=Butyrivibrio sp. JL13D10 TaxID=3236815 RepID=UPI0038B48D38
MDVYHKEAWAEINTDAIRNNLKTISKKLGDKVGICAVLKADAYGHGIRGIRKCLSKCPHVTMVAVGKMSELTTLSSQHYDDGIPTLLIGAADPEEIESKLQNNSISAKDSIFTLYKTEWIDKLNSIGERLGVKIRIHVRLDRYDSGMGISYDDYTRNEKKLFSSENLDVCGLYTHLYSSYSDDEQSIRAELEYFKAFSDKIDPDYRKNLMVHALNSSLVFRFPEYAFDMVRVGSAMYGLADKKDSDMQFAMKICARIFDVRDIEDDVPLSYESNCKRRGKRKIARIMLGYWDAPLIFTQKDVRVSINKRLFYPADEMCMDNLCIDITGADDIKIGDIAVILGEEGVSAYEILDRNNISYVHGEWLCMTAGRLEKFYI